jgi:hypothetical protein
VPPDAELQKRATFSTLNVGLVGTGYRTRAICVASSGTNRSAIYYAYECVAFSVTTKVAQHRVARINNHNNSTFQWNFSLRLNSITPNHLLFYPTKNYGIVVYHLATLVPAQVGSSNYDVLTNHSSPLVHTYVSCPEMVRNSDGAGSCMRERERERERETLIEPAFVNFSPARN